MKFSIIVPVYNVEDYIIKCLESIYNQTYKNFEVIIVDDGSMDNSTLLIKKYIKDKNNFIYYRKENGGLSDARNYGLKFITGNYLIFIDSDDYINKELLYNLNEEIKKNNPDIIKFGLNFIKNDNIIEMKKENFYNLEVNEAIDKLLRDELFEPAWFYCYKFSFWQKNKFKYTTGKLHEDFGLTPLIIMNSQKISSISYIGYNYRQRPNSIMRNQDYEKTKRKAEDFYFHYQFLIKEIEKTKINSTIFKSYLANSLILKITELQKEDYHKYKKKLKEEKVFDNILTDTLPRKIKKVILQISPKIYYRKK